MTAIQYISQLPTAASVGDTDLVPLTQGSTGPLTGTTRAATVAKLFTSPTFTSTITLGSNQVNYVQIVGGASGQPVTVTTVGGDASPDLRFVLPSRGLVNIPRLALGNAASGAATASPRVFSLLAAPGLSGTGGQAFRVGGNVFGTNLSASLAGYYVFNADTDNVTFSNTSNGMTLNYRGHTMTTGWSGGRTTDFSFLNVTATGTAGVTAYHVSGGSEVRTAANMGGSPGAERGSIFARNEIAQIKTGSGPHFKQLFGEEFDIAVETQAGVLWKGGAKVVLLNNDANRGFQQDFAYSVGMQAAGTAPGVQIAYAIGGVEGWFPLTETSTVMEAIVESAIIGGPAAAIGAGVDFSNLARIRESAFKSIGYIVDGLGNSGALVASGETLQTRGSVVAKTAVVNTIEVLDGGLYGGIITVNVGASPGGGTNAAASVDAWGMVGTFSIATNGANYAVNDTFTVSGGTTSGAAVFTGTIADNVLTVTSVSSGTILNRTALGAGAIAGTRIIAFGTGAGGTGTYILDTSQNVSTPTVFTVGGAATGVITSVNAGGAVTGIRMTNIGRYTVLPASPVAVTTSGAGSGFTFSPSFTILSVAVTTPGTLYSEFRPPPVNATGSTGTYRAASFRTTMTGTQVPLALNAGSSTQVDSLTISAAGPTITTGAGVPVATTPKGSLYLRTGGGVGSTLYVSQGGGTWNAVAGV